MPVRVWGILLATASLVACASASTDADIKTALQRAAASVPELPRDARIVVVNADSEMDAWTEVARATSEGPLGLSRVLAQAFARAERQRAAFAVGGPYPQLNDRVLLDAFSAVRAPRLPGLTLLLVSPKPPSDSLRDAAAAHGAVLLHRPLPD
jgi:hypothetical protein